MGDFGERLRREREMRGITIEEIADSTKIPKRRLEALENEQFDLLPGGIFNRGFVRSYARYVGIDPEQAVADYVAASHEQPPPEDKFPLEIQEKRPVKGTPSLNPRQSWMPIALAVLALVAVMLAWTKWGHRGLVRKTNSGNPVGQRAQAVPVQSSAEPLPAQAPEGSGAGTGHPAALTGGSVTTAGPASASNVQAGHQSGQPSPRPRPRSNTLAISARADSWVSITADGKIVMEGILDANQQRSVTFANELVLKTGNAGGLDVTYNGKPLGGLGSDNEVRTLRFPSRPRVP